MTWSKGVNWSKTVITVEFKCPRWINWRSHWRMVRLKVMSQLDRPVNCRFWSGHEKSTGQLVTTIELVVAMMNQLDYQWHGLPVTTGDLEVAMVNQMDYRRQLKISMWPWWVNWITSDNWRSWSGQEESTGLLVTTEDLEAALSQLDYQWQLKILK